MIVGPDLGRLAWVVASWGGCGNGKRYALVVACSVGSSRPTYEQVRLACLVLPKNWAKRFGSDLSVGDFAAATDFDLASDDVVAQNDSSGLIVERQHDGSVGVEEYGHKALKFAGAVGCDANFGHQSGVSHHQGNVGHVAGPNVQLPAATVEEVKLFDRPQRQSRAFEDATFQDSATIYGGYFKGSRG